MNEPDYKKKQSCIKQTIAIPWRKQPNDVLVVTSICHCQISQWYGEKREQNLFRGVLVSQRSDDRARTAKNKEKGVTKTTKICSRATCKLAGVEQPVANFHSSSGSADNLSSSCGKCVLASNQAGIKRRRISYEGPTVTEKLCPSKECEQAGVLQPIANFYISKGASCGLSEKCKSCFTRINYERRELISAILQVHKHGKCCVQCGQTDVRTFHNDHLDGSTKIRQKDGTTIKAMSWVTIGKLPAELAKTQILCANCHRKTTTQRRNSTSSYNGQRARLIAIVNQFKANGCTICHIRDLDFSMFDCDHLDPSEKKEAITEMVMRRCSEVELKEELLKCRCLCSSCHMIHTAEQFGYRQFDDFTAEVLQKAREILDKFQNQL